MIKKCLFPAAGLGTRFLPATKAVPKEMLPILNKPLLQYGVEEALSAGIHNIAIVTGRGKRSIEDHFDNSFELESQLIGTPQEKYLLEIQEIILKSQITYIRQKKMLGLGHAILTGEPLIGDESFAVVLADDLCFNPSKGVLSQMLQIYEKYKCSIVAVQEVPMSQVSNYGIIEGKLINDSNDLYEVDNMIEKPEQNKSTSNLAIIGRYILTPSIFTILKGVSPDKSNEIQLTDALLIQAQNERVLAYKFKGNRFDCGSVKGLVEANVFFAKKQGIL
jgi:UTP--glucose-1-phosphate uridylyltransferase